MLASNSALIASERAILPPDAGKRFVERSCRNRDKEDNRNKYNKSSSTHANRRFLQKHKRKNAYLYQLLVPYIAYSILKFSEQIYHFFLDCVPLRGVPLRPWRPPSLRQTHWIRQTRGLRMTRGKYGLRSAISVVIHT